MFKIKDDYFNKIECPKKNCHLLNCLFRHEGLVNNPTVHKRTIEQVEEPDNKRIKREDGPKVIHHIVINEEKRKSNIERLIKYYNNKIDIAKKKEATTKFNDNDNENNNDNNNKPIEKEFELAIKANSEQEYDSIINEFLKEDNGMKDQNQDPEFLLPKDLINSPAILPVRKNNIENMYAIIKLNEPHLKTPKLKAIEEEFKIASTASKHVYMHTIKRKIHELKNPEKFKTKKRELTDEDYYQELNKLLIPKEKLIRYGFIMDIPEPIKPNDQRVCRRCNQEFKMSEQLEPIHCSFHAGKLFKKDKKRVYECCGAVVGDNEAEPCTSYNYHVFYWDGPGEMQEFLPFKFTKNIFERTENAYKALGIDCEMGFTTQGFELLRITAVDFFSGNEVIDVLVKPIGTVIDLNSRWSGINEIAPDACEFEELIKLLNSVMDDETILIGHGLENDLNSMRIIHNKIVDTAILYPKLKSSPKFRYSLKYLVFTYLGKVIQTGQHDSGEDALGAIDVVKYFIKKDLLN